MEIFASTSSLAFFLIPFIFNRGVGDKIVGSPGKPRLRMTKKSVVSPCSLRRYEEFPRGARKETLPRGAIPRSGKKIGFELGHALLFHSPTDLSTEAESGNSDSA